MQIVVLRRDHPFAWALMPQILTRVLAFVDKYDPDTPKAELFEQVTRMFANGDPRLAIWAAVDGNRVLGHLFAQPEPVHLDRGPWQYMLIRQAEIDPGFDTRQVTRQVFDLVEQWTRQLGLDRLYMMTHRNETAMARRWGFAAWKTIMVKSVSQKGLAPQPDNGISEVAVSASNEAG